MAKKPTEQQRALWTFLITTLAAPFLAGLIVFAAGAVIGVLGRWMPPDMAALDPAGRMGWAASHALQAFVWSAWPAALGGAAMAGLILWRGEVSWLTAAITGAVATVLFGVLGANRLAPHLTPIAFVGACVAIALWWFLTRIKILR